MKPTCSARRDDLEVPYTPFEYADAANPLQPTAMIDGNGTVFGGLCNADD